MFINDICEKLSFSVVGDNNPNVWGIRYAAQAGERDIAIVKKRKEAEITAARVILTNKIILGLDKTILIGHGRLLENARNIAKLLALHGDCQDYSLEENLNLLPAGYMLGNNVTMGANIRIGALSIIKSNSHIGNGCIIGEQCYIGAGTIIGNNVIIKPGTRIASPAFFRYADSSVNDFVGFGKVIIGDNVTIGTNTVIQRGTFGDTVIGSNTGIGDSVVIGHDVQIGSACAIVSQSGIAGGARIEDSVEILGQAGIADNVVVGEGAVVKAKSLITKNVAAYEVVSGLYGRRHIDELRLRAKLTR